MKKNLFLKHILPLAIMPLLLPFSGNVVSTQKNTSFKPSKQTLVQGVSAQKEVKISQVKPVKKEVQKQITVSSNGISILKPIKMKKLVTVEATPKTKRKEVAPIVKTKPTVKKVKKKIAPKKVVTTNKTNERFQWKKIKDAKNIQKLSIATPLHVRGFKFKTTKVKSWSSGLDTQLATLNKKLRKIEIAENIIKEDKVSVKMAKNIAMDFPAISPLKMDGQSSPVKIKKEIKEKKKIVINKKEEKPIKVTPSKVIEKEVASAKPKAVIKKSPATTVKPEKIDLKITEDEIKPKVAMGNTSFEQILSSHPVFMSSQNKQPENKVVSKGEASKKKMNTQKVTTQKQKPTGLIAATDPKSIQKSNPILNPAVQKAVEKMTSKEAKSERVSAPVKRKRAKKKAIKSSLSIRAYEVSIGKGAADYVENFEVRKLYDDASYPMNSSKEVFSLHETLASRTGTVSIALRKSGFYETKFQAFLEEGAFAMNVPFFEKGSFDKFMSDKKIVGTGGYILVEMDERTKSVEVHDSKYFTNFFLNSDFKEVSGSEQVSFVLFVGVEPGNALLSYKTKKGKEVDKIIHVGEEEVLFEVNAYSDKSIDVLSFNETEVFGKASTEFELTSKHMTAFNSSYKPIQVGPGRFEFKWPISDMTFRNYLEFGHLGDNIYVGYKDNLNIEIPSNDYVVHVFNQFGLQSIENQCLTQLNLERAPLESTIGAFSTNGPMNYKMLFQDRNGKFYDEISEKTKKIFILGEFQGMINMSIKYKNGGKDFITTPCSDEAYLIEQL